MAMEKRRNGDTQKNKAMEVYEPLLIIVHPSGLEHAWTRLVRRAEPFTRPPKNKFMCREHAKRNHPKSLNQSQACLPMLKPWAKWHHLPWKDWTVAILDRF
jgi:hypothetical protein